MRTDASMTAALVGDIAPDGQAGELAAELAAIYAALQIHSQSAFSFGASGAIQVMQVMPGAPPAVQNPVLPLIDAIRNHLYGQCYVRDCVDEVPQPSQNLIPVLSQANQTPDRWDPGWRIYQQNPDGRIMVQKGERSRTAVVGEYAANKWPGMTPTVGEQVNLRVYPGTGDLQQGFYYAFGSALSDQFDEYALLRFYFNVQAYAAPELLAGLTAQMNRYGVPFRFKTLVDASAYRRADAAVLYVAKKHYDLVASLLCDLRVTLGDKLRTSTPMFSKTLVPGIGMAEEPGTGESFGMHRCRLVAEGVVDAWLAGSQAVAARSAAVQQRFATNGIDLHTPYLNPRSVNLFDASVFAGGINL